MAYGHVFPLSSLWKYEANGVICGEKWMSAGNDGISKMISLYHTLHILMFCLVGLG